MKKYITNIITILIQGEYMEDKTFTVSEINAYINKKLKLDSNLKNILIRGELSNYKEYPSGHSYFTLKDEKSQIKGVMFKGNKMRFLNFKPENGMKVIIKGKIEVYEKNGGYQLYATKITEDGVGNLHIAFEQLKKKLKKEGLFDDAHKKEIPKYPKRIGVVTAETGAAIRDIKTTIERRYPICEILLFPTLVQGDQAAPQIVRQIKYAQEFDLDILIVGRGGGSIEDLWAFNEEIVAHAVYDCDIPIISAVGHEIDTTIIDFVSDLRAATPTGAAELAVPDMNKIKNELNQLTNRLKMNITDKLISNKARLTHICEKNIFKNPESLYEIKRMHLDNSIIKIDSVAKNIITENQNRLIKIKSSYIFKNPESLYEDNERKLDNLITNLNITSKQIISENRNKLFKIENSHILKNPHDITKKKTDAYMKNLNKLEVLNPLLTLKRGYSIAQSGEKIVTSVKDVESGDEIDIKVNDGIINTKVI